VAVRRRASFVPAVGFKGRPKVFRQFATSHSGPATHGADASGSLSINASTSNPRLLS